MKFQVEITKKDLNEFAKRISDAGDFPFETNPKKQFREFFFWEYDNSLDLRNKVRIKEIK